MFKPGNTIGKNGRPRGVKNRLAGDVLSDLLAVWNEPIKEGSDIRRGPAALRIMSRERTHDFVKVFANVLPKEFLVESTAAELSDEDLDALIAQLRVRALEAREEKALTGVEIKMLPHAH